MIRKIDIKADWDDFPWNSIVTNSRYRQNNLKSKWDTLSRKFYLVFNDLLKNKFKS